MKKLKSLFFTTLLSLCSQMIADGQPGYPPDPFEAQGGQTAPAISSAGQQAMAWLNESDAQAYGASWLDAGGLLKDTVTQKQWIAGMLATRSPLGPAMSRVLASHTVTGSLPYGTKGNFIILKYNTQFQNGGYSSEIVTLMMEGPFAGWQVVGYQIIGR